MLMWENICLFLSQRDKESSAGLLLVKNKPTDDRTTGLTVMDFLRNSDIISSCELHRSICMCFTFLRPPAVPFTTFFGMSQHVPLNCIWTRCKLLWSQSHQICTKYRRTPSGEQCVMAAESAHQRGPTLIKESRESQPEHSKPKNTLLLPTRGEQEGLSSSGKCLYLHHKQLNSNSKAF